MKRRSLLLALAAVLLLHGVLFWLDLGPRPLVGDEARYVARAEAFARGETPAPDLLWPPLYARLLGFVFSATGGSRPAAIVLQTALLAGAALLLRDLARRLAGPGPGADLAGLLLLLQPALAAHAHAFWPEIVHLALWLAALWLLAARREHAPWLAALGLLLGIALLTKSLLQGFLPLIFAAVALGKPWRRALAHASLVAACTAATVAPTVLSNYAMTGVPAIADSARFNLWLGLGDRTRRDRLDAAGGRLYAELEASAPSFRERDRILEQRIRALFAERGIGATLGAQLSRQYFRLFDKDSLLTDQLPAGLLAERGLGYADAPAALATPLRWASWAAHGLLLAAFPLGLVLFPPGRRVWVWLALSFVAYNLAIFLLLHVKSRYFLQILPAFALFAGPALARLCSSPRALLRGLGGPRLAAALLGAGLLLFLAFGGGLLERSPGADAAASPRPRRIILVSMDTVRADFVSGYGGVDATPRLAGIAAEGTLFTRFYAASTYTIPAHMSMFTGLDAAEHGVHALKARLAPEVPTLAELLAGAGYATHAFHEGGFVAPRFGFARGFEQYVELPRLGLVGSELPGVFAWMRSQGERPYFLFLHTYAAHFPFGGYERYRSEHPERGLPSRSELERVCACPPGGEAAAQAAPEAERLLCSLANQLAEDRSELFECHPRRLPPAFVASPRFALDRAALLRSYEQRVARLDRAIGALRDDLAERGQWDDTLLVVTADHGEAFFEHDAISEHGYVPFEEVLRAPLVVSYPRFLREGGVRVVDELAWHLDLLPTLLGFAGAPAPAGLRGRDLRGRMRGAQGRPEPRDLFPAVLRAAHLPQLPLRRVAISGSRKWIEGHEAFGAAGDLLFDLATDAGERRNRCPQEAEACARLEAATRDWEQGLRRVAAVDQRTGAPLGESAREDRGTTELPEEEQRKLRALGYVE